MDDRPVKILSIDAWRDESGWYWNDLFTIMEVSPEDYNFGMTNRAILKWLREQDILTEESKGKVLIDRNEGTEGYFIEVLAKNTREPLIAISTIH